MRVPALPCYLELNTACVRALPEPSCVDFFLANQLSMVYFTTLSKLQEHTGIDLLAEFPKIAGVWAKIKALPSYQAQDLEKRPHIMSDEDLTGLGVKYYPAAGTIENYATPYSKTFKRVVPGEPRPLRVVAR